MWISCDVEIDQTFCLAQHVEPAVAWLEGKLRQAIRPGIGFGQFDREAVEWLMTKQVCKVRIAGCCVRDDEVNMGG